MTSLSGHVPSGCTKSGSSPTGPIQILQALRRWMQKIGVRLPYSSIRPNTFSRPSTINDQPSCHDTLPGAG